MRSVNVNRKRGFSICVVKKEKIVYSIDVVAIV